MTEPPRIWPIACESTPKDYSKYNIGDVIMCRHSIHDCFCVPMVWCGEDKLNPMCRLLLSAVSEPAATEPEPSQNVAASRDGNKSASDDDDDDDGSTSSFNAGGHWSSDDDEHSDESSGSLGLLTCANWWSSKMSFDKPEDDRLHVPIEVTQLFDNPLATYRQLMLGLTHRTEREVVVEVAYGHPMHADIQNNADRPTRWHSVRYVYLDKKLIRKIVVFARVFDQDEYVEWNHSFEPSASINDYDFEYRAQMTRVSIVIKPSHVPIVHQRLTNCRNGVPVIASLRPPLASGWGVSLTSQEESGNKTIIIYGAKSLVQHQLALLIDFFKPSEFKYTVSKDECVFSRRSGKLEQRPVKLARTRPLFYYTWLFGAALVLFRAAPQMGPYVLLEIVDWLPDMALLSHRGKIDYLYKIRATLTALSDAAENKRARIC